MDDTLLAQARFHPNLAKYWLLSGTLLLCVSVIGIPLLILWYPIGLWGVRRYIANMSAELTSRKLIVRKGILTRTENTVPLDKITDMALIQGPIMRLFGIHKLTVETAGQSGNGALINLMGVVDVNEFRAQVLNQKAKLSDNEKNTKPESDTNILILQYLQKISTSLVQIESALTHPKKD